MFGVTQTWKEEFIKRNVRCRENVAEKRNKRQQFLKSIATMLPTKSIRAFGHSFTASTRLGFSGTLDSYRPPGSYARAG
jgi:hypothetical protein